MLYGPKILPFYFGRHILNFLLLHIKVLRKQDDPFWNSWLLPQRNAPRRIPCRISDVNATRRNATRRNATHRCEPALIVTNTNDIREEIKRRINMGNAFYYSLEKILLSRLLSKKLKVKTYKTIIYRLYCVVVKLGPSPWERSIY